MTSADPNSEDAYRRARSRLTALHDAFAQRAEQADFDTETADVLLYRQLGWFERTGQVLFPLALVAFLPALPFAAVAALAFWALIRLWRGGQHLSLSGVGSGHQRLRWAHTESLLVGGPLLLNLVLIAVLLGSPRLQQLAIGALDAGSSATTWVTCVRASAGPDAAACTGALTKAVSQTWEQTSSAPDQAAWTLKGPLTREVNRIVSDGVDGAMAPVWVTADPQIAAVQTQWNNLLRYLEAQPTGALGVQLHEWTSQAPALGWSMLAQPLAQPLTWAVAFAAVFGLSALPQRVFHWLLARRAAVTYRSEQQARTARERVEQIAQSIQVLDHKWAAQRAAGCAQDPGDWLASFLVRRAAFAVVGVALGAVFLPVFDLFGDLMDLADAAEGVDGIADMSGQGGFEDYGALADQVVGADDPFLVDVNGDSVMDMTTEGTPVHWTDGYVRADGTVVSGYYATNPDGVTFNNLGYLRSRTG